MADIHNLRELLAKATPGPWKAHKLDKPIGYAEWEIHWSDDGECIAEVVHGNYDANLIVEAVNALPALLDELEQTRRLLKQVKSLAIEMPCDCDGEEIECLACAIREVLVE